MSQELNHADRELSRTLYEDLAALKIRIAFAEISEDELDEYDRELSSVSEFDYSEAAQKRALKLIERKLNKRLRRQFVRKTLPHTLQFVSIALLVIFIGLTTAVATMRPVRLRLMDFIAQLEENYSAVSLVFNENEEIVIPDEWKGKYYPFYIPEDYTFSHIDDLYNSVHYTAMDDRVLEFCEYTAEDYSSIDIDENNGFDIVINDNFGIAMTDGRCTTITWCIDDIYFSLYFSGDLETAKRIAESVRLINSSK